MKHKQAHPYAWDREPVDDRPSAFGSTTGHASLCGEHSPRDPARKPVSRGGWGVKSMLAFCVALLALGGWSIAALAPLLKH